MPRKSSFDHAAIAWRLQKEDRDHWTELLKNQRNDETNLAGARITSYQQPTVLETTQSQIKLKSRDQLVAMSLQQST